MKHKKVIYIPTGGSANEHDAKEDDPNEWCDQMNAYE